MVEHNIITYIAGQTPYITTKNHMLLTVFLVGVGLLKM